MSRASIGVTSATKEVLGAAKPDGMQWDEFLALLLRAVDADHFLDLADARHARSEEEAVDRARARYHRHRMDPSRSLSGTDLRHRLHLRRLLDAMEATGGSLRLATADAGMDADTIGAVLADLDDRLHAARQALSA